MGIFGALDYAGDRRELYVFALEAHSRMLYLAFVHSQTTATEPNQDRTPPPGRKGCLWLDEYSLSKWAKVEQLKYEAV